MNFFVTKEAVATAKRTYLPMEEKLALVDYCAQRCVDRVEITTSDRRELVPPMYKASDARRLQYLVGILCSEYFGAAFDVEKEDARLMTADSFDAVAGGHPVTELRELSHDKRVGKKAACLLADWRELADMLTTEIGGMVAVMNDPVARAAKLMAMQTSPEAVKDSLKELETLKERINNLRREPGEVEQIHV